MPVYWVQQVVRRVVVQGAVDVEAEWFVAPEYWLAREILQRGVAAIYLVAFIAAARQFRALIGEHGMLPVPRLLERVSFGTAPSIFHFHYSDRIFAVVCWSGAALSAAVVAGVTNLVPLWAAMLTWLVLWLLYLSIVNVGQRWYGFGWESLLLEAGFLTIFLGNDETAPPLLVLLLARWLVFRVEFGAGPDQASRRPMLARSDLLVLSPRDPADAGAA
jgi:Lipase maturation factor